MRSKLEAGGGSISTSSRVVRQRDGEDDEKRSLTTLYDAVDETSFW